MISAQFQRHTAGPIRHFQKSRTTKYVHELILYESSYISVVGSRNIRPRLSRPQQDIEDPNYNVTCWSRDCQLMSPLTQYTCPSHVPITTNWPGRIPFECEIDRMIMYHHTASLTYKRSDQIEIQTDLYSRRCVHNLKAPASNECVRIQLRHNYSTQPQPTAARESSSLRDASRRSRQVLIQLIET